MGPRDAQVPSHDEPTPQAMSTRSKNPRIIDEDGDESDIASIDLAPRLLCAFPDQVAVSIPRTDEVVGRAWLDTQGISDPKVSREHLSFSRHSGQLFVKDHRSHNGTFVMGSQLVPDVPVALQEGATIRVGQTIFVYRGLFPIDASPNPPLGTLVAPWGLQKLRQALFARAFQPGLNVMIDGPSGTEKEALAREVAHRLRPGTKYISINLAAIPREHFEATLFGWEKNSFTGAFRTNAGHLRSAAGGTIFLDNLEALPSELVPHLLRFLAYRQVQPVGARDSSPPVDCLVIAATNRGVMELVNGDVLRRDVVARFPLRLTLPGLQDRPEDLYAILAARWESTHKTNLDPSAMRVDEEAIEKLMLHTWPENVRELNKLVDGLNPREGIKRRVIDNYLGLDSSPVSRPG